MIIMGIDPGLATIGFGIVDRQGQEIRLCDYGVITTPAGMSLPKRLSIIYDDMTTLIQQYQPENMAFEELFFYRNVTTAIQVGHARGVSVIAANNAIGAENLYEYTPMQVKQAVCGYGHADKQQVQQMVRILLKMDHIPRPDDAADALAIAICHAQAYQLSSEFRIQ